MLVGFAVSSRRAGEAAPPPAPFRLMSAARVSISDAYADLIASPGVISPVSKWRRLAVLLPNHPVAHATLRKFPTGAPLAATKVGR